MSTATKDPIPNAQKWKEVRKEAKARPRGRAMRLQEVVIIRKTQDGKEEQVRIRKRARCNMLLDRTGRCWFCGHVDPDVRRAWKAEQR